MYHLNLKANVKNYFLKSRFSGFTTCLSHNCAQFGLCCLQGRLNPRSQSTLNSCFSLSLAEPRSKSSCESGLAGQLIYNRVRIFLSANMISVPFCNPPTDHDFPRKWFKLLGRDRKRREHDHDSRSLCLFTRCKRAFISREDASVLTLPSSGKVSLFTGSASSHPTHLPSPHHC